jgi:hypothetical protein
MRRLSLAAALLVATFAFAARADDTQPPLIRHVPVAKAMKGDSVSISAQMEDQSEIFAPTLYFRYPGARGYSSIAMARKGDSFVASVQATADIEYWIEAYDEFGNGPTREGSPERPHKVAVADKVSAPRPAPVARVEAPPPPPTTRAEPPPPPADFDAQRSVETLPPPVVEQPVMPPDVFVQEEAKPIYKEWWFIGGGAVVGVAVVVVAVVALQPDPVYRNVFSASFKRP